MALDPSIAMGYQPIKLENPMNNLAQLMQLEGARNQNRLADLQLTQHRQTQDDANNLNALYARFTKPNGTIDEAGLIQGAAQGNMGSKIPTFRKQFAEAAEAKGKLDKQNIDLVDAKLKQSRGFLDGVTTPEQYIAWHEGNHKDPILGPMLASRGVTAEQSRAKIAEALQTPGGLEKLIAESKLGSEKFMELNKPSYQKTNSGKVETLLALPGLGGAPTTVNTTQMTTTPGQDQSSRDAAFSRGVQIRGQDLTDARSKETNQSGKAPAGYRYKPDGSLEAIPGGPADVKAGAEGAKKVTDAKDVISILDEVDGILPNATGGYIGTGVDAVLGAANVSTGGAKAGSQLKVLQGALISKMPKMSGPQSDKDVLLYREMAGQIADSSLPIATRQAASTAVRRLNEKYAGMQSGEGNPSANPQDAQAMEWAKANPNDPRSKAIMQRLGGK